MQFISGKTAALIAKLKIDDPDLFNILKSLSEDASKVQQSLDALTKIVDLSAPSRVVKVRLGTAAQTLANGANTAVLFDTLEIDSNSFWDPAASKSVFYIREDGVYVFGSTAHFDINAVGDRIIRVYRNGSLTAPNNLCQTRVQTNAIAAATTTISCSGGAYLRAGEYLSAGVYQASGGNLDLLTGNTNFWCAKLGMINSVVNR